MLFYTPQNFNMEPEHQIMPWKSCQQTYFVSWTETFMSLATLQRLSKDICLSTLAFCILQNILKSWSIKHKELSSNIKSFSGTWMLNQLKWTWPASLANVSYFQQKHPFGSEYKHLIIKHIWKSLWMEPTQWATTSCYKLQERVSYLHFSGWNHPSETHLFWGHLKWVP